MEGRPLSFARGLVLNVGSSTLKWSVIARDEGAALVGATEAWSASEGAARLAYVVDRAGPVDAVGHRIVHGGPAFEHACRVDDGVRAALGALIQLDPLHLGPALEVLDAARAAWPDAVHVAAFDTAFHATLPAEARAYAVPEAWRDTLGVRRYGFHGHSVSHAVIRAGELLPVAPRRLVVAHLGSGCSITAVRDGRSVDTTMGMTPLEGVVMGTRSGSIDPSIALLAQRRLGLDAAACDEILNRGSGLLALSGTTGSLRDLRAAAASGSERAAFACRVFELSVRRHVGAMIGSLGGLDALVFTGGIGENDAALRRDCVGAIGFAGVRLDATANERAVGDRRIDDGAGPVAALVVEAREDLAIARSMSEVLANV